MCALVPSLCPVLKVNRMFWYSRWCVEIGSDNQKDSCRTHKSSSMRSEDRTCLKRQKRPNKETYETDINVTPTRYSLQIPIPVDSRLASRLCIRHTASALVVRSRRRRQYLNVVPSMKTRSAGRSYWTPLRAWPELEMRCAAIQHEKGEASTEKIVQCLQREPPCREIIWPSPWPTRLPFLPLLPGVCPGPWCHEPQQR